MPNDYPPPQPGPFLDDDPHIEIDNVTFGYDARRSILADLSLTFPRGKVTTILGGSGCGKTTLLHLIAGVHALASGQIRIDGDTVDPHDRSRLYRQRGRLGMLLQFGGLFTDLSVHENVAFPIREHRDWSDAMISERVQMKLDAVGLPDAANLRVAELSGGMARRVALARAIALDPTLILYDEPFAGLDRVNLGRIARLIRSVNHAHGATSLVVSHDIAESMAISDHIVLLADGGRVIAQGTPVALLASRDPHTVAFLHAGEDL